MVQATSKAPFISSADSLGVDWSIWYMRLKWLDPKQPNQVKNYWEALSKDDQIGLMAFLVELNLLGVHVPAYRYIQMLYDGVGPEVVECLNSALEGLDYQPGPLLKRFQQNAEFADWVHHVQTALDVMNTPIEHKDSRTPQEIKDAKWTLRRVLDSALSGSRRYQRIMAGAQTMPSLISKALEESIYTPK